MSKVHRALFLKEVLESQDGNMTGVHDIPDDDHLSKLLVSSIEDADNIDDFINDMHYYASQIDNAIEVAERHQADLEAQESSLVD